MGRNDFSCTSAKPLCEFVQLPPRIHSFRIYSKVEMCQCTPKFHWGFWDDPLRWPRFPCTLRSHLSLHLQPKLKVLQMQMSLGLELLRGLGLVGLVVERVESESDT